MATLDHPPRRPMSKHNDDGIDVHIHGPIFCPNDPPNNVPVPPCSAIGDVAHEGNGYDESQDPWCDGCAFVPVYQGYRAMARLAQGDMDRKVTTGSRVARSLVSGDDCFQLVHLEINVWHDFDPTRNYGAGLIPAAMRNSALFLGRLIGNIAPCLKDKDVRVKITNAAVRANPLYYNAQVRSLAMLRCRSLTIVDEPVYSQALGRQIHQEVTGQTAPVDYIKLCDELEERADIRHQKVLLNELFTRAVDRDRVAFLDARQQLKDAYAAEHTVGTALFNGHAQVLGIPP